ncbi:MAG TPA: type II secretion system F family protein [Mycobacteriales bacterium]|jgi:pilus assembly protein TadC|nr:type II secretion system F family protein [Mycobacteriales bacterium]
MALALLLGGVAGVVLGLAVALAGPPALSRLEPRAVREERERLAADLPLALDLLAACLAGGAALPAAVRAVAAAVPGPCGHRLGRVCAALEVGSPARDAWAWLAEGGDELAASAVRTLVRSEEGGTPVADAVARLALEAREAAKARGQEGAERAGVLAVGPLGLCFLPAFVLLGVVPVVAGLVGPLLAGL